MLCHQNEMCNMSSDLPKALHLKGLVRMWCLEYHRLPQIYQINVKKIAEVVKSEMTANLKINCSSLCN